MRVSSIIIVVVFVTIIITTTAIPVYAQGQQQQQQTSIPPIGLSDDVVTMALFFIIGQANVTTLEISETGDMRVLLEHKGGNSTTTTGTQSHNTTIFNPVARPYNATFTMSLDLTPEEATAYGIKPGTYVISKEGT